MFPRLSMGRCFLALAGSVIQALGVCNIHAFADVTEGGVLGLLLLLEHWLHLSPAISSVVLNGLCYLFGWKTLGRDFLWYSILSCGGFSISYALLEPFAPLWPAVIASPLASAVLGAVFVGVGAGLCVRVGGAPSGDDALAMALVQRTHWDIQWIYLLSDLIVLVLSVSYIPLQKLGWSLLTVVLSGQMIGWMQKIPFRLKEQ
ncbi:MAG: YitT family protein [Aristaeellaceae bacterium]